jgi:hypothetical protein
MEKATVEINYKELREAVNSLNNSGLLETPIKLVGIPKETVLKNFMSAVDSIPNNEEDKFPGPEVVLAFYNKVLDEEEKVVENKGKDKEEKVVEDKDKGKGKGEKKKFITEMISEKKWKKNEIIKATIDKFGGSESSIATMLSDGKNPKYNSFEALIKVSEDGIFGFETKD